MISSIWLIITKHFFGYKLHQKWLNLIEYLVLDLGGVLKVCDTFEHTKSSITQSLTTQRYHLLVCHQGEQMYKLQIFFTIAGIECQPHSVIKQHVVL